MNDDNVPRWRRRFDSYGRAFVLLREAVEMLQDRALTPIEREGVVQRFNYTWELAWKLIADILAFEGVVVSPSGPRQILKAAYETGYIQDGPLWMQALDARNRMSHTYDVAAFEQVTQDIVSSYFGLFDALYDSCVERVLGSP